MKELFTVIGFITFSIIVIVGVVLLYSILIDHIAERFAVQCDYLKRLSASDLRRFKEAAEREIEVRALEARELEGPNG